jgi:hypothetical protein
MDVTAVVTAGAAGLAAVLAGINLYVSGQRELRKWTREALLEVVVTFLDASFSHSSACRVTSPSGPVPEVEWRRLRKAAVVAHHAETNTLTRLRLLAPSKVVRDAEALHETEHELVAVCFAGELPTREELDEALAPVRRAREKFLQSARSALQLSDTAPITHRHRDTGWYEIRDATDTSDYWSGVKP